MILQDSRALVGRLKINPRYSVSYCQDLARTYTRYKRPTLNQARGAFSKKSLSRIRNCIAWMNLFAEKKYVWSKAKRKGFHFKLSFGTVTLSTAQKHSDSYILHRMFFPLLKYLDRQCNVKNYVWRCEIQPKRWKQRNERCIHFHFVSDKYIPWRKLRNKWNELQRKHGYLSDDFDANSTDIKSVLSEHESAAYLSKYFSKSEDEEALKVTCKLYGASRNLQQMNCTIKEEELETFRAEAHYHIKQHCRALRAENNYTVYLNEVTRSSVLSPEIERKFLTSFELFHSRSDGIRKYID